jgi:Asp/Glu/hydantoin racemase
MSGTKGRRKYQKYFGHAIGIATMEDAASVRIPVPGCVDNASTYRFPVKVREIEGFSGGWQHNPFKPIRDEQGNYSPAVSKTVATVKKLEQDGVRAITLACGFFSYLQDTLAEEVDVPVFTSPLILVPMVSSMIGKKKKVGIITASKELLSEEFLTPVGIDQSIPHVVAGLDTPGRFYPDFLDPESLETSIITAAENLLQTHPEIGAIVLECSDFAVASADINKSLGLPVFDYISLVNYVYRVLFPKRHEGFL